MERLPRDARSATSSDQPYCPQQYDIIRIQFDPQTGREQAGPRPAFVLSNAKYNSITRLCVLCPITSQVKGYPFEATVPMGFRTTGVVLSDQIKNLDWSARGAQFVENCPELAAEVIGKIKALLQI
jgi:mRNA interferase MazF